VPPCCLIKVSQARRGIVICLQIRERKTFYLEKHFYHLIEIDCIISGTKIIKRKRATLEERNAVRMLRLWRKPKVTNGCLRDSVSTHLGKRLFVGDKVVLKVRCSR
jgi:hypothetical protein